MILSYIAASGVPQYLYDTSVDQLSLLINSVTTAETMPIASPDIQWDF